MGKKTPQNPQLFFKLLYFLPLSKVNFPFSWIHFYILYEPIMLCKLLIDVISKLINILDINFIISKTYV